MSVSTLMYDAYTCTTQMVLVNNLQRSSTFRTTVWCFTSTQPRQLNIPIEVNLTMQEFFLFKQPFIAGWRQHSCSLPGKK